jgi:predicted PurR-regulated permease PerM
MNVSKKDIRRIFTKLDQELHELQFQNNTSALIQISADYKDIKEVIQYFESSLDTLKTQNESLKEILKDSIREMCVINEKMLDGIITKEEVDDKLTIIASNLINTTSNTPLHQKVKEFFNNAISPKMIVIAIAVIFLISAFLFKPALTKDIIHEITPLVKSAK